MAEGFRKKGTKAWQNQAGGAPTPAQGKGPGWKQGDAPKPGTSSRRIKIVVLLALLGAVVGGAIYWALYIQGSAEPVFVVVGANPTKDADKLNVPIDPFGWQSGQQWLTEAKARGIRVAPGDDGNPTAISSENDGLAKWISSFPSGTWRAPLVIYLGLHGGTDSSGPFLFTGGSSSEGPNRVSVKAIIAALEKHVPSRNKVLILDPSRLPPDPIYGQLHDDFVARLKNDLNADIKRCPNLVVICGTDVDQRGYESEELQATPFAQFVALGLYGKAATDSDHITALQLYEYVLNQTKDWSEKNRSKPQTPILLPEGQEGIDRASALKVATRRAGNVPEAPVPKKFDDKTAIDDLEARWLEHDKLAATVPSPASYTPRAWRRYRELLLRYEWAARAGDKPTCNALKVSLAGLSDTIKAGPLETKEFGSAGNSLAFWAATANGGAIPDPPPGTSLTVDLAKNPTLLAEPGAPIGFSAKVLDILSHSSTADPAGFAVRLQQAAAQLSKATPAAQRSAEAHLPVMVNRFYQVDLKPTDATADWKPTDPPANWLKAFEVKRLAERTAVGVPVEGKANPYAERIWPVIQKEIGTADAERREGEDRLFGTTEAKAAQTPDQKLEAARKRYEQLAEFARTLRRALIQRDRVLADLPFLTRWVAAVGPTSPFAKSLVSLWDDVHKLDRNIDDLAKPADAASTEDALVKLGKSIGQLEILAKLVGKDFDEIAGKFKSACDEATKSGSFQDAWTNVQVLLPSAAIDQKTRMLLLKGSWEKSFDLAKAETKPPLSPLTAEQFQLQQRNAAVLRGRLARAALGSDVLDTQGVGTSLLNTVAVGGKLSDLENVPETASAKWGDQAATLGAELGKHYKVLGQPHPDATKDLNPAAERTSRVAVAFGPDTGYEPAAANHRLRWRDLLVGLAERTALDYWYGEAKLPYYKGIVDSYLLDAKTKAVAGLPAGAAFIPPTGSQLELALRAPPLDDAKRPPIDWTSERDRDLAFKIDIPASFPVRGHATAFRSLHGLDVLVAATATTPATDRTIYPIGPNVPLTMANKLKTIDEKSELSRSECSTSADVYFRGQHPRQTQPIRVNRKPDLVLLDPLPKEEEKKVSVAIEAGKNLKLGTVVVLIDLSGSMKQDLKGEKIGIKDDDWRDKDAPSKFNIAMVALEKLLESLPKDTPLKIRVFSDTVEPTKSRLVYPDPDPKLKDKPSVVWEPGNMALLTALMTRLKLLTPYGYTPLVQSIIDACEQDFDNAQSGGKTLIVLTDGIEQDSDALPNAAQMQKHRKRLRDAYDNDARIRSVSHQVVLLALAPAEAALAKILFDDVPKFDNQSGVWPIKNTDPTLGQTELNTALLDAIWPKLKLLDKKARPVDEFPRGVWSSRRKMDGREKLHWSPLFDAGLYNAESQPQRGAPPVNFLTVPGDRVILRFEPAKPDGTGLKIHRTLYADYLNSLNRPSTLSGRDKKWTATAIENWIETVQAPARYKARVCIELSEPAVLQQTRPDVLWWDVTPRDAEPSKPRTVRITKLHAYPAPTWEIDASDWPHGKADTDFAAGQLRVWVPSESSTEQYSNDGELAIKYDEQPSDKQVRFGFNEMHAFGGETLVPCLVVRVTHPLNQPVHAKLMGLSDPTGRKQEINAEHRYYKRESETKGRQFSEYTAIFGPITQSQIDEGSIKVQFLAVDLNPQNQVMELRPERSQSKSALDTYRPPERK